MANVLPRLCEELRCGTRETLLPTLDELDELLESDSVDIMTSSLAEVTRLLLERLEEANESLRDRDRDDTHSDDDGTEHSIERSGVQYCLEMQIHAKISSIIFRGLLKSTDQATWMVEHTAILDFVLHALQPQRDGTLHRSYGEALQCVKTLTQQGVKLFSVRREIVLALANSISEFHRIDAAILLVQVLTDLSSESAECADEIERIVATRLLVLRKETVLLFFRSVLDQRDSWSHLHMPLHRQQEQEWSLVDRLDAIVKELKHGTPMEKLIMIKALHFEINAIKKLLVSKGGVGELITLQRLAPSPLIRENAAELLNALKKTDEEYLGELIDCQLRHPNVDILAPGFCNSDFEKYDWFSFAECVRRLTSGDDAEVLHTLNELPRNIYTLAVLCLDHGLIAILLELIAADHAVNEGVKDVAWTLLLEMNYELPTVGATTTNNYQQLTLVALRSLQGDYPPERRQQAALLLSLQLSTSATACDILVNNEGGIPVLVGLLAEEDDGAFAGSLCDLVRELSNESQDFAAEIDLIVRGILENDDYVQCESIRYQNLLSIHRKPAGVVLGRKGDHAIKSLKRNMDILSNGSETEKLIVLKQMRTLATSWSQEHLDVLCNHILEIVPILLCETAELKQLTVEILRILAALDDGCRRKVLFAGRIYGKDNPEVFEEFLGFDRLEERTKRAKLSGSDLEGDDNDSDGWERSWVTIDHPADP